MALQSLKKKDRKITKITHPEHRPGEGLGEQGQGHSAGGGAPREDDGRGVDGDVVEGQLVVLLVDAAAEPGPTPVQQVAVDPPLLPSGVGCGVWGVA